MTRPRLVAPALVVVALALFPLGAGNYPVKLPQEILIWGIFAMSLDLLMGYVGLVSFGHSAFFGVGGYVAALLLTKAGTGMISALALPALAAGLCALVIGFFSIRPIICSSRSHSPSCAAIVTVTGRSPPSAGPRCRRNSAR